MQQYLDIIHNLPMLEDCKTASKEQLVMSHLRMVDSIVSKKYGKAHRYYADLVQTGNVALMKSAESYDPETGIAFASYAIPWINMAIMNYVLDNARDIRVLTSKPLRKAFFNQGKYKRADGTVDRERMSSEIGVSMEDIRELEDRTRISYKTFEMGEDEETVVIPDYDSDPAEIVQYLQYENFIAKDMKESLSVLTDRERFIIENRYFVDEPMGFQHIAPIFGVSIERIRQIEKAAFAKLKKVLAEKFESCKLAA